MGNSEMQYGVRDASYLAAGGLKGITALVNTFYDYMDVLPQARKIRAMHPVDLESSRDRLTLFLCGWMGGPKLYQEKYGPISIPQIHKTFAVGAPERDAWLLCMSRALDDQAYPESFRTYLLEQLFVPAERIRSVCVNRI